MVVTPSAVVAPASVVAMTAVVTMASMMPVVTAIGAGRRGQQGDTRCERSNRQ
jgi:hypothetical protein